MPDDKFKSALEGKNVPVLVLDNKWYTLLSGLEKSPEMLELENELKELLKKQGKLNNDLKRIRKQKAKLMDEIVSSMDMENGSEIQKKSKQEIEILNQSMEDYQNEMLDLPREIDAVNHQLMLHTMDICYNIMKENTSEINEIEEWITETRIELKKKIVIRQEKEIRNELMYSYMHDVFGPEVLDIFDLAYNPEEEHIVRQEPQQVKSVRLNDSKTGEEE